MQFAILASLFAATALAMPPFGGHAGGCAAIEASCKAPSPEVLTQIRKDCAAQYAANGNTADDPSLPSIHVNCQVAKILKAQELPFLGSIMKP
ncbi:hypothetical protein LTS10_000343 [Elasticomyces elasticus]|nr:hypothetical protein LTS10_000343 [Elasticomyces elasticus]